MMADLAPMPSAIAGALGRPVWVELRAPQERRRLRRTPVPLVDGRGRTVVLVTGYLAGPSSMAEMATWLDAAGFRVVIADMQRNRRSSSSGVDHIGTALDECGEAVTLIGHSRGGQQCRVAAQRRPDQIEQLITLGAPVRAHLPRQAVLRLSVEGLRLLGRTPIGPDIDLERDRQYAAELAAPFRVDVPWTSVFSKSDGIVEWQACLDAAAAPVEVSSSHAGLLASVDSYRAIAGVLGR